MRKVQECSPNFFGGGIALSIVPSIMLEGTVLEASRLTTLLFIGLTYPPIWFLYVYLLIGCIKRANLRMPKPRTSLAIAVALYLVMFFVTLLLFKGVGSGRYPENLQFATWRQLNSPICFMSAFFLFIAARDAVPTSQSVINKIAGYTYGIYLFQCHKTFQNILWRDILRFEHYYWFSTWSYIAYSILGVCIIMVLGLFLEFVFKWTYKQLQKRIPVLR